VCTQCRNLTAEKLVAKMTEAAEFSGREVEAHESLTQEMQ
jgi:hypothetical protein